VTDSRGCPAAISVFDGNTSDSVTLMPQVRKLQEKYGLKHVAAVDDRGMISTKAIEELKADGLDWITVRDRSPRLPG
jgi:transposase